MASTSTSIFTFSDTSTPFGTGMFQVRPKSVRSMVVVAVAPRCCEPCAPEPATDGAHHHVLHPEIHLRVRRIDVPEHVFCPLFAGLCRRFVVCTINSLLTQSIPRARRRLSAAEIAAFDAFLRAYATTSHVL